MKHRSIAAAALLTSTLLFGGCTDSDASAVNGALEVTCKIGPNEYKKHFLGLSDNVSYFVEQTETIDVSEYHYRVIFKPETIVPNVDIDTSVSMTSLEQVRDYARTLEFDLTQLPSELLARYIRDQEARLVELENALAPFVDAKVVQNAWAIGLSKACENAIEVLRGGV